MQFYAVNLFYARERADDIRNKGCYNFVGQSRRNAEIRCASAILISIVSREGEREVVQPRRDIVRRLVIHPEETPRMLPTRAHGARAPCRRRIR